jgi:hypothetical protein
MSGVFWFRNSGTFFIGACSTKQVTLPTHTRVIKHFRCTNHGVGISSWITGRTRILRALQALILRSLLLIAVAPAAARAEEPPTITWRQYFGDNQVNVESLAAFDLFLNDEGQVQVLGKRNWGAEVGFVRTYSADGDTSSEVIIGRGTTNPDYRFQVGWRDAAGSTYWTIGTAISNPAHGRLRKVSETGSLQWERISGSGANGEWHGVTGDAEGNVYVTGTTLGSIGGLNAGLTDSTLHKFSNEGQLQWIRQFGGPVFDEARFNAVDASDGVMVAGTTRIPNGDWNVFLTRFTTEGEQSWSRQIGGILRDEVTALNTDSIGNSILATALNIGNQSGPSGSVLGWDTNIHKYSADGTPLWSRVIVSPDGLGSLNVRDIETDRGGNIYLAASLRTNSSRDDGYLFKLNPSGDVLWSFFFDDLKCSTVAVDEAGRIAVAGVFDWRNSDQVPAEKWVAMLQQRPIPEPRGVLPLLIALVVSTAVFWPNSCRRPSPREVFRRQCGRDEYQCCP